MTCSNSEADQVQTSAAFRFGMIGLPAGIAVLLGCVLFANRALEVSSLTDSVCVVAIVLFALARWILPKARRFWQLELVTFCYVIVSVAATFVCIIDSGHATPMASLITVTLWAALVFRYELTWLTLVMVEAIAAMILLGGHIAGNNIWLQVFVINVPIAWTLRRMVHFGYKELLELRDRERQLVDEKQAAIHQLKTESANRLAAEREHQEIECLLSEARRRESIGTIAGGVAHDFNNYLLAISSIAESVKFSLKDRPSLDSLQEIQNLAQNASSVCSQMLSVTGKSATHRSVIDLNVLVTDTIHLMRATLPANCLVETAQLACKPLYISVDEPQIQLTIVNLIRNAAESMQPSGGTIRVSTRVWTDFPQDREETGAASVTLGSRQTLPVACVSVSDSGHGMDQATLGQVFDPYFTTKPTGHGFGLATASGIVKSHDGAIHVVSRLGSGTTVEILLPTTKPTASATAPRQTAKAKGASSEKQTNLPSANESSKGRLLLIEDEPHVRRATTGLLTRLGWEVVSAENGSKGLEIASRASSSFRVAIVDYSMPDMNGLDVIRQLRNTLPSSTRIVLASGLAPPDLHAGEPTGPDVLLKKPFRFDDLVVAIDPAGNLADV